MKFHPFTSFHSSYQVIVRDRDKKGLQTTPLLLIALCKEYFDILRETFTQYITFLIEREQGRLYSCTLKSCNHVVLHRPLCEDSDKIHEDRTSTYILHLSDWGLTDPEF